MKFSNDGMHDVMMNNAIRYVHSLKYSSYQGVFVVEDQVKVKDMNTYQDCNAQINFS